MSIVRVLISSTAPDAPPSGAAPADDGRADPGLSHLVQDLLWAHAVPHDEVDHIRVRPFPTGPARTTEAAVFVRSATDAVARERVRGLLTRTGEPLARLGLSAEVPHS